MRPATARFLTAVQASHRIAVQIQPLQNGDPLGNPLTEAISGTVNLDATAAIQASLDLVVVDDTIDGLAKDHTSILAPYGNELKVSRGITYPDGTTELISLGVFRINEANVSDNGAGAQIQIAAQDRAIRIIDAKFEDAYQIASGTNYITAIHDTLIAVYPDMDFNFPSTDLLTPLLNAGENSDRWAFCQAMATAIGMRLFFDGDGICVIRPFALDGANPVASIIEGQDGVLVSAARAWSRQGSYNRVIITGENTTGGTPVRGIATDDDPNSPTYYYGPFGPLPYFESSQFVTTTAQAQDMAQSILGRQLGTTQKVSFGSVVNPALEPDDVVLIQRAIAGIDENNIIDQLSIPLGPEGAMTGSTRATVSV